MAGLYLPTSAMLCSSLMVGSLQSLWLAKSNSWQYDFASSQLSFVLLASALSCHCKEPMVTVSEAQERAVSKSSVMIVFICFIPIFIPPHLRGSIFSVAYTPNEVLIGLSVVVRVAVLGVHYPSILSIRDILTRRPIIVRGTVN